MNGTAYNNTTQTLNISYTLIQPVIPGKQLTYETPAQLAIQHYEGYGLTVYHALYGRQLSTHHNTWSRRYSDTH